MTTVAGIPPVHSGGTHAELMPNAGPQPLPEARAECNGAEAGGSRLQANVGLALAPTCALACFLLLAVANYLPTHTPTLCAPSSRGLGGGQQGPRLGDTLRRSNVPG